MDKKYEIRKLARNYNLMGLNELFGALRLFYPISILYFTEITGSFAAGMGVFSFATLSMALLEIPTGILSDKWGRRHLLILGCLFEFLAVASYAFAASPFLVSGTIWLYTGGFFFGLAGALFSGNNYALLYETAQNLKQNNKLPHILGRNSSMEQFGLAISGVLAGLLLWLGIDFHTLVLLSLIPMGLNIGVAVLTTEPPKHYMTEDNAWQHMKYATRLLIGNKELRLLALCSSWKTGLGMSTHLFMPKFIETVWPLWAVPFYRTGQNLVGALSFWFAGKVTDRFGQIKALMSSSLLSEGLSVISYVFSNAFSPFLLFITQSTWAIGNTADNALQQKHFSSAQRSTMGSLISFMGSIFNAIMAVSLGFIADMIGGRYALILIAIAGAPVIIGYYFLYRNDKPKAA